MSGQAAFDKLVRPAAREFHELQSNYSGKISHVPIQQAVIPSPRSVLSCDKRLPFDTWNLSETQRHVFGNPRPMFDSTQTLFQQFFTLRIQVPQVRQRKFQRIPENSVADQQRLQISEHQFEKFPTPTTFAC